MIHSRHRTRRIRAAHDLLKRRRKHEEYQDSIKGLDAIELLRRRQYGSEKAMLKALDKPMFGCPVTEDWNNDAFCKEVIWEMKLQRALDEGKFSVKEWSVGIRIDTVPSV